MTDETLEILGNKEIIAINQDPVVGTSISPFRWGINVGALRCFEVNGSRHNCIQQPDWTFNNSFPAQYWSGESQNGTVFMLVFLPPWVHRASNRVGF